ncbi:hypothetical protein INR49_028991 [Caranx melampygus]|nr:hypothetical protein INR49_028991 [Caranx melampygus]
MGEQEERETCLFFRAACGLCQRKSEEEGAGTEGKGGGSEYVLHFELDEKTTYIEKEKKNGVVK